MASTCVDATRSDGESSTGVECGPAAPASSKTSEIDTSGAPNSVVGFHTGRRPVRPAPRGARPGPRRRPRRRRPRAARAPRRRAACPRAPPAPTRRSRFAARRPRSTPIAAASAASAASAAQTRRAEDIDNLVEDHWNAAKTGSSPPSCLACFEPFASAGEMVPLLMCAQGHRICKGCSIKLMKFDATGCPVCKAPLPDTLILDWGLMDSLRTSENAFTARAPP